MTITKEPKCRAVCKGKPGMVMDELVAAFKALRAQGLSEEDALRRAHDPDRLAETFPGGSLGTFRATAEAFVVSGCAECAVNLAYTEKPAEK